MTAILIKAEKTDWFYTFLNCQFQVISIRQHSVLVKSNSDEGYREPYNVHEFPKSNVLIQN